MVYLTMEGINPDQDTSIAESMQRNMIRITGVKYLESINVLSIRTGPISTSIEIELSDKLDGEISIDQMKKNIVDKIVDKSISEMVVVPQLTSLLDIYFEDMSKYPQLHDMPSSYRRVTVEMPGKYPTDEGRVDFEEETILSIREFLQQPTLDSNSIHLERVAKQQNKPNRIVVRFVLLGSFNQVYTPEQILQRFREDYEQNPDDYMNIYQVTNVLFKDPGIVIKDMKLSSLESLKQQKMKVANVDQSTLDNLERKYKPVKNYGCNYTLNDIKNNVITHQTPLYYECLSTVDNYLYGL